MSGTFEDENSTFGGEDLRADLDAVIIGAGLSQGDDLAQAMQDYYSSVSEYESIPTPLSALFLIFSLFAAVLSLR